MIGRRRTGQALRSASFIPMPLSLRWFVKSTSSMEFFFTIPMSKIKPIMLKIFKDLPENFVVTHYHSWAVIPESVPAELKVTAINADGLVMSIAHRNHDVRGVQFHPESVMTQHGKKLIENWIGI